MTRNVRATYWTKCNNDEYSSVKLDRSDIDSLNKACDTKNGTYEECDKIFSQLIAQSCSSDKVLKKRTVIDNIFSTSIDIDMSRKYRLSQMKK
jgi:hypothetical protein